MAIIEFLGCIFLVICLMIILANFWLWIVFAVAVVTSVGCGVAILLPPDTPNIGAADRKLGAAAGLVLCMIIAIVAWNFIPPVWKGTSLKGKGPKDQVAFVASIKDQLAEARRHPLRTEGFPVSIKTAAEPWVFEITDITPVKHTFRENDNTSGGGNIETVVTGHQAKIRTPIEEFSVQVAYDGYEVALKFSDSLDCKYAERKAFFDKHVVGDWIGFKGLIWVSESEKWYCGGVDEVSTVPNPK